MGAEALPVAEPEPGDNRFNDPEWSRNPYFDFWKQAYLITTRWLEDVLDKTEGLDERTRQRAEFYLKQIASALSPSNFPVHQSRGAARDAVRPAARTSCRAWPTSSTTSSGRATSCSISQTDVRGLRGRPQRGDRAGQGRLPERAHAAHPVRAHDRERARGAAADRAAVDQQVLHPRPRTRRSPSSATWWTRASRCSSCPGSIRTSASGTRPSRTT